MGYIRKDLGYDIVCNNCGIIYCFADLYEKPPVEQRYSYSLCQCCSKPKQCDYNCFCRRMF